MRLDYVLPWRERAFVSIAEAAEILCRSPEWIRSRVSEGRLDGRRLTRNGTIVVTVGSVLRLIERSEPAGAQLRRSRVGLELVVDNT